MDFEEIEENYQKELEGAENEFLKATIGVKDSKSAEAIYLAKIKAARERYYKEVMNYLEQQNAGGGKKDKKKKEGKTKPFIIEPGNFELSWWQKKKLAWKLWFFKKHFHTRNKIRKNTPSFVSYQYFKWRLFFKKIVNAVADSYYRTTSDISLAFQHGYDWFKSGVKKGMNYLSELPEKTLAKLKKLKEGFKKKGKGETMGGGGGVEEKGEKGKVNSGGVEEKEGVAEESEDSGENKEEKK